MRCLLLYFEPFGADTINSSEEACRLIDPHIKGVLIDKYRLPVSFAGSIRDATILVEKIDPDFIICVGQAAGRATINLERVAINLANSKNPDSDGYLPGGVKLAEVSRTTYEKEGVS